MANYIALLSDQRQGESFANGPFTNLDAACRWAEHEVRNKAKQYNMFAHGEADLWWVSDHEDPEHDDETVLEIQVMELIAPQHTWRTAK